MLLSRDRYQVLESYLIISLVQSITDKVVYIRFQLFYRVKDLS